MKYTKFTVTNYKGIPKVELDLKKKPNLNIFTLVGLNESGKTSILEAINLFRRGIQKSDAHTLIPKNLQHNFNEEISVEAELELDDNELREIEDHFKKNYKFHIKSSGPTIKIKRTYKFENSVPVDTEDWRDINWTLNFLGKSSRERKEKPFRSWSEEKKSEFKKLIEKKFLPKILYYQDFLFEFPEKIYLDPADDQSPKQNEYREVVQDILDSIGPKLTVEKHLLERMKNSHEKSHKEALDQSLLKMSAKLNKEILGKWEEIFGGSIGARGKEIDISCGSEHENAKHFIELQIKQGSDRYSINERSLGFRWFFSFLIFTVFRKDRPSDPGETLFLLDEPASNLHQSSQQKLLDSLESIVSDCKLIYSTHSHHLIDTKWLAGTYIVKNDAINYENPVDGNARETQISLDLYKNFATNYPGEKDHFKPILDSLQYLPSKLEMVPPVIFTEGKSDYFTFKYMANVVFEDKYDLNFYPGAGVNTYSTPFRLYLAWNKKFIVLFDSDTAGRKAKEKYIKEVDPDLTNRIFTLQDVENGWKGFTTEELFSEEERIRVIQSCFQDHEKEEGFVKSKFHTAIEYLYIRNEAFDLNKTTKDGFKKVFEFLESKLND